MPFIGSVRGSFGPQGRFNLLPTTSLYAFTSATFTPGGATGRIGPNITQARTGVGNPSWASTYLNMTTNGYQLWTVPTTGSYQIEVAGAIGGDGTTSTAGNPLSNGAGGAKMRGTIALTSGDILEIIVGQSGTRYRGTSSWSSGTGGGGSFVSKSNALLIAAGGGGGRAGDNSSFQSWQYGQTTTAGATTSVGSGATGGNGYTGTSAQYSAGGAGWLSDSNEPTDPGSYGSMKAFGRPNGFLGGLASTYTGAGGFWDDQGGFGGGGGCFASSAGGGGYSGGAVGGPSTSGVSGGGGGSYFDASVSSRATSNGSYEGSSSGITNLGSYNTSTGYVTITKL